MLPQSIKNPFKNGVENGVEKVSKNDAKIIENGSPKGAQSRPKTAKILKKNNVKKRGRKMLKKKLK